MIKSYMWNSMALFAYKTVIPKTSFSPEILVESDSSFTPPGSRCFLVPGQNLEPFRACIKLVWFPAVLSRDIRQQVWTRSRAQKWRTQWKIEQIAQNWDGSTPSTCLRTRSMLVEKRQECFNINNCLSFLCICVYISNYLPNTSTWMPLKPFKETETENKCFHFVKLYHYSSCFLGVKVC